MKKETIQPKTKLKNLNVENLVSTVFPFAKYYKQEDSFFVKKGIAGWPTWVIIIKRESVFQDHMVLFVCENASFTQISILTDPEILIKDKGLISRTKYFIDTKKYGVLNPHNLEIIDAHRLYKFLSDQGIQLHEPTE